MEKCKDCHWHKVTDQKNQTNSSVQGRCFAKSPSVSAVVMPVMNQISREITPQIVEVTSWPLTNQDSEACGDFKVAIVLEETLN